MATPPRYGNIRTLQHESPKSQLHHTVPALNLKLVKKKCELCSQYCKTVFATIHKNYQDHFFCSSTCLEMQVRILREEEREIMWQMNKK